MICYIVFYNYIILYLYILFLPNKYKHNIRIGMKYSTAISCTVIHYFDIKCYSCLAVFLKLFFAEPESLSSLEYYLP